MSFEKIKNYFKQKKQKEANWFVVEMKKDDVSYIIDKHTLEFMLAEKVDLSYLINNNALNRLGWHIGNDKKVYERYQINSNGKLLYDFCKTEAVGKSYLEALKEINNNDSSEKLAKEKAEIRLNFRKNQIKSIQKYNANELTKTNKERAL